MTAVLTCYHESMGQRARLVRAGLGLGVVVLLSASNARAQVPAQYDVDDDYQQQPVQQQQPQPVWDPNTGQYVYPQQQYPQQQYPQQQYDPQYQQQYQQPQYGFVGAHPIPYDQGSGICMQQGAHMHVYAPFDQYLFRESGGYFYFVGDLADFGYTAQTWMYQGNHPIPASYGGGYCYMDWNHRHHYAPPVGLPFNYVGGVYVYAGTWDPAYWTYRNRYVSYYGGYYRNNYWGGRYYSIRPPHVYRPTLTVGAPGVHVVAPGWGGGVRVGAPPVRVGVGFSPPPPVRVAPPPRVYVAPPAVGPRPAVRIAPPVRR